MSFLDFENTPDTPRRAVTLDEFQRANERRRADFVNKRGEKFEPFNIFELASAGVAEAGELANFCKKIRRGDFELDDAARAYIGKEIGDTITYMCLTAIKAGISFNDAVVQKFNEVSDRVKSEVKI